MLTRRTTLLGLLAAGPALGLFSRPAMAEPEIFAEGGLAIRGADPVAFFTRGASVAGNMDHALMWMGSTWLFSSAANRDAFEMNPKAYAPQYGGYCAFAMSRGSIASSVPEAWTIYEDRLYLNFNLAVRENWLRDIPGNIAAAAPYWPAILTS